VEHGIPSGEGTMTWKDGQLYKGIEIDIKTFCKKISQMTQILNKAKSKCNKSLICNNILSFARLEYFNVIKFFLFISK
jgi:hypothetical protein